MVALLMTAKAQVDAGEQVTGLAGRLLSVCLPRPDGSISLLLSHYII